MSNHSREKFKKFSASIQESTEDFLITKKLEEGRSRNTIQAYTYDLVMFLKFVGRLMEQIDDSLELLEDIKTTHIKRFLLSLDKRGYTKTALARKIATLKSFFAHAQFMGYAKVNPMERIKTPRISRAEHLPKFLSKGEMDKLLNHAKQNHWIEYYIMLRFMYATMCRVSELCNIKVKDVNTNRGIVNLRGKGNKERWVPVDDKTVILIEKIILPNRSSFNAALFMNTQGNPIKPRVVQGLFQQLKKELNYPKDKKLTPHVFRHTGATMLRRNGMDISELQDVLGHASPNTTRIYAKNDIESINASYKRMHPLNK